MKHQKKKKERKKEKENGFLTLTVENNCSKLITFYWQPLSEYCQEGFNNIL